MSAIVSDFAPGMPCCPIFGNEFYILRFNKTMNVTRENIDSLNAVISVTVNSSDIKEPVDAAIKKLAKTMNLPGFRPGMVPSGIVKQRYGKAVLAEELNKVANKALFDYIQQNNIRFLGEPMISEDRQQQIDLDGGAEEFSFHYDLGLVPPVHIDSSALGAFTKQAITVDDETLNENIENLRRRFGKEEKAESIEDGDMISGEFFETEADGSEKADGFKKKTFFIYDRIEKEEAKKLLLGKKTDDVLDLHPNNVFEDNAKTAVYLGIKPEEAENLSENFKFRVGDINRITPAELDEEFYGRLFGADKVKTDEEFRAELTSILQRDAQNESDVRLLNDIRAAVLEKVQFELPEKFLSRWMQNTDKNLTTPEAAAEHVEKNREGIRWEVIRMTLADEGQFTASEEEIFANARSMVIGKLQEMGMPADDEERLKSIVFNVLQNETEYNKIRTFIVEQKVLLSLRDKVQVTETPTDYKEFWKQQL